MTTADIDRATAIRIAARVIAAIEQTDRSSRQKALLARKIAGLLYDHSAKAFNEKGEPRT